MTQSQNYWYFSRKYRIFRVFTGNFLKFSGINTKLYEILFSRSFQDFGNFKIVKYQNFNAIEFLQTPTLNFVNTRKETQKFFPTLSVTLKINYTTLLPLCTNVRQGSQAHVDNRPEKQLTAEKCLLVSALTHSPTMTESFNSSLVPRFFKLA